MTVRFWSSWLGLSLTALGCSEPPAPRAPTSVESADLVAEAHKRLVRGETLLAEQYFVTAWRQGTPGRRVLPALLGICLRNHRQSAALHYVDRALLEEPAEPRLLELAAVLEYDIGRKESALFRLRELWAAEELPGRLWYLLGELEAELGDRNAARVALRRYLESAPHGRHRLAARRLLSTLEPSAEDES